MIRAGIAGSGNYELEISVAGEEGVVIVPLVLESVALPVVIAWFRPMKMQLHTH